MYNDAWWQASVAFDRELERNPDFLYTEEAQCVMRIFDAENERLTRVLLKQSEGSKQSEG